jgi:virulence factor Mce-like protein
MHTQPRRPLLTGAASAALLVVVMAGVLVSGIPGGPRVQWPWSATETLHVQLADADALEPHASVEIAGVKVGEVRSVAISGAMSVATLELSERYADIHDDATVYLRPHGLFGPKYIDIVPGTATAPLLHDGATIHMARTVQPVDLDAVLQALQAPEQQNLRTAIVELGKAAASRGDDVNHLIAAADSLTQVLDRPVTAVDSVSPQLSDLIVQDESFNASFQRVPLDRLIANSAQGVRAFAANAGHIESMLVNADSALASLDSSLSGESSDLQAALRALANPPPAARQALSTSDKLTRFTYLLGLFGATLDGRDTSDRFDLDVAGTTPGSDGIVSAIENVRSAFAAYDSCTPGVNHCPATGPLAGQAHYLRVQVFNFPPGGVPGGGISICGLPILGLPGLSSIGCPAASAAPPLRSTLTGEGFASFSALFAA